MNSYEIKKWIEILGDALTYAYSIYNNLIEYKFKGKGKDIVHMVIEENIKNIKQDYEKMKKIAPNSIRIPIGEVFDFVPIEIEDKILYLNKEDRYSYMQGLLDYGTILFYQFEKDFNCDTEELIRLSGLLFLDEHEIRITSKIFDINFDFIVSFAEICRRYNINIEFNKKGKTIPISEYAYIPDKDIKKRIEPFKYKTLPRIARIQAVNELLRKLNVYANTDRKKIAEFIEAVTGGNTDTPGENTYTIKHLSDKTEEQAKDILKKIRINQK